MTPEANSNSGGDYLQRLAERDAATERHFGEHYGRLLSALVRTRRRSFPEDRVRDVVQETFTRVLTAVRSGSLRESDRFSAFVIGVCENVLRETTRSAARLQPVEAARLEQRSPDDPEARAGARRSLEAARVVLDALPARDREILELVLLLDSDKDAVCRRFGVTRDHLRVLLHRARRRFGKLLAGGAQVEEPR